MTVLCQYCRERAVAASLRISFAVNDETWDDTALHFGLTLEADQRHKAMCFEQFMPGVMAYVEELREKLRLAQEKQSTAPEPKPSAPLWLAQAFEQRAQHEPNCSWSREACVCSCGLFELRLHLANAITAQTKVSRQS